MFIVALTLTIALAFSIYLRRRQMRRHSGDSKLLDFYEAQARNDLANLDEMGATVKDLTTQLSLARSDVMRLMSENSSLKAHSSDVIAKAEALMDKATEVLGLDEPDWLRDHPRLELVLDEKDSTVQFVADEPSVDVDAPIDFVHVDYDETHVKTKDKRTSMQLIRFDSSGYSD